MNWESITVQSMNFTWTELSFRLTVEQFVAVRSNRKTCVDLV